MQLKKTPNILCILISWYFLNQTMKPQKVACNKVEHNKIVLKIKNEIPYLCLAVFPYILKVIVFLKEKYINLQE